MTVRELTPEECRRFVDAASFSFETTADVEPVSGVVAQERALGALEFGLEVRQPRFHVVVVGSSGAGRTFSARKMAERVARTLPTPDDLLLLPNPRRPSEPSALFMPAGEGRAFSDTMANLYSKLVESLHAATEGERFKQAQTRAQRRSRRAEAELETTLVASAKELGFRLERTGDEIEITSLPDEEGEATKESLPPPSLEPVSGGGGPSANDPLELVKLAVEEFESRLADIHEEAEAELRTSLKTFLAEALKGHFAPIIAKYAARSDVSAFLTELEGAVMTQINRLIDEPRGEESAILSRGFIVPTLLTEHQPGSGAPVIEVAHPTLTALFGRSHSPPDEAFPPEPGFAVAGALHQANGGFLVLPATALLKNEALYEQLKACLLSGKFVVPEQNPSYYRGSSEELLFPPIPIDVKVILIAGPGLFQELHAADPEFSQLFKVQARFESTLAAAEAEQTYPAFLSGLSKARGLLPLTRGAVAELVFFGGRAAESQTKVTSCLGLIAEVATEASFLATKRGKSVIDEDAVRGAIEGAQRRGAQFRDELHDLLRRGLIRIETQGSIVGQVNAVSVLSDGPTSFGRPCRVTAVVYPGHEGPMNIAREVEMSGPLHSKGVLVLKGFLASRFAQTRPLSFSASLVFEQTYEAIDGDSASSSELYALLSALSGLPIRQDLAVTGSVDQWGQIQPVGGLNEKIEAFFDICQAKGGLTGTQGVLIPSNNVDSLMLRDDVVTAVRQNRFHVYAVSSVEAGIELLTGVKARIASPEGDGQDTVYGRVDARLQKFHDALATRRVDR
ncbi:MAG: AAA family ATPase [Myxococcales bacterium]|nr:AAA family ATPase [Myxococcales bacterium]